MHKCNIQSAYFQIANDYHDWLVDGLRYGHYVFAFQKGNIYPETETEKTIRTKFMVKQDLFCSVQGLKWNQYFKVSLQKISVICLQEWKTNTVLDSVKS